jgi:muconolactone delta-isomerase
MEFLVHIEIAPPAAVPADTLARLREAEAARAAELGGAGVLLRLWREPGRWANWGLWASQDETALHAAIGSLPLRPYMTVAVHALEAHPNDPSRAGHAGGGG